MDKEKNLRRLSFTILFLFYIEATCFISSGIYLEKQEFIIAILLFFTALGFAFWSGNLIKKFGMLEHCYNINNREVKNGIQKEERRE